MRRPFDFEEFRKNPDRGRGEFLALPRREQQLYRALARELAYDADFDFDELFGPLARELEHHYGERAVMRLFHPERLLSPPVSWPLYDAEVARLLGSLGIATDPEAIEWLAREGAVMQLPRVDGRALFFFRHMLAAAQELTFKPHAHWG